MSRRMKRPKPPKAALPNKSSLPVAESPTEFAPGMYYVDRPSKFKSEVARPNSIVAALGLGEVVPIMVPCAYKTTVYRRMKLDANGVLQPSTDPL